MAPGYDCLWLGSWRASVPMGKFVEYESRRSETFEVRRYAATGWFCDELSAAATAASFGWLLGELEDTAT
jgi:hypothetical protein